MKICKKCLIEKPLEEYHRNKNLKDGHVNICKECANAKSRVWMEDNPERYKRNYTNNGFRRHGITEAIYMELLVKQNYGCAACGCLPSGHRYSGERLNIDHDHSCCPGPYSCGKCVRGLLCVGCNSALGHLNDSIERIDKLKKYLMPD